jgi:hypothetical protein
MSGAELARRSRSCDSHAVFLGRRISLLVGVAVCSVAVLIPAAAGIAGHHGPTATQSAKKKVKVVFLKGRVFSDGFVTPGQPETVTITRMPERTRLKAAIEPPPTTPQCGEFYFCDFAPVGPAPGTPPFRTNGKGRATITFVMPSTYNIASDPFDPASRHPVTWMNGQAVHIDVEGTKRLPRVKKAGFGFGRAVVKLS